MTSIDSRLRGNFKPFLSEVRDLSAAINAVPFDRNRQRIRSHFETIPGYIDAGAEFAAIRLSNPQYVARIPHGEDTNNPLRDTLLPSVEALKQGMGIRNIQQIIAYDDHPEHAAAVCYYVPGNVMHEINEGALLNVPDVHFSELITSYMNMQSQGLAVDAFTSNTLYNSQDGFTTIDYEQNNNGQTIEDKLTEFARDVLFYQARFRRASRVPSYCRRFKNLSVSALKSESLGETMEIEWREEMRELQREQSSFGY